MALRPGIAGKTSNPVSGNYICMFVCFFLGAEKEDTDVQHFLLVRVGPELAEFWESKRHPASPKTTGKGRPTLSRGFWRGRGSFGLPKIGDFRPDS